MAGDWFRSYLTDRRQKVSLSPEVSRDHTCRSNEGVGWLPLTTGVPQGSILGPTLFLIYINDLIDSLSVVQGAPRASLYADDTVLILEAHDTEKAESDGNAVLSTIKSYLDKNRLVLNAQKTEFTVFATRNSRVLTPEIKICDTALHRTKSALFLGVEFDEGLTWRPHIHRLCPKLASVVYLIRNISHRVDKETITIAYHALFESRLRYGVECWGGSSDATRVFKMQKRAVRALHGVWNQRMSCRPLFPASNILTLPALYIQGLAVRAHSLPLRTVHEVHDHNTRRRDRLFVERMRIEATARGPTHLGSRILNKLPITVTDLPHTIFKKRLKEILIRVCPYSLREFMEADLSST